MDTGFGVVDTGGEMDEKLGLGGGMGCGFFGVWTVGIEPSTKDEEKQNGHASRMFTLDLEKIDSQNVHSTNSGDVKGW